MQIAALVLAGTLTILGASAAGVPPEQLGQVPAETAVVEEQVTTGTISR